MGIVIETERTFMRHLTPNDAKEFYALNLDEDVLQYTGDIPFATIEEARKFIEVYDQYQKYRVGRLAVIDRKENEFLGWCGLKFTPNKNEYDIGFRFYKKYWNKGFATETANACIDFGFKQLGLSEIVGRAMRTNIASIKVIEKIGMTFKTYIDFEGQKGVIYSISKESNIRKTTDISSL